MMNLVVKARNPKFLLSKIVINQLLIIVVYPEVFEVFYTRWKEQEVKRTNVLKTVQFKNSICNVRYPKNSLFKGQFRKY